MSSAALSKSADELVAEIVFLRTAADKTAFIVEGSTDIRMLERFIDESRCDLVSADGKDNAIKVVEALNNLGFVGFLCLVDRDFDHYININYENHSILYSDHTDSEIMLVRSSALDTVIAELGSSSKIDALGGVGAVRDLISNQVKILGAIRVYSAVKQLNLSFDGLSLDIVCKKKLSFDRVELIKKVYNNSKKQKPSYEDDLLAVDDIVASQGDSWVLCCGHDFVEFLGRALQGLCGSCAAQVVSADSLERLLRAAYDSKDFDGSALKGKIQAWEWANRPYAVLKAA